MQKENAKLTKKFKLFTNVRVLRARVELDDKKSYIVRVNAYRYNKDKRGGNRERKRNRAKREKRKRNGDGRGYDSVYKEKQKYY